MIILTEGKVCPICDSPLPPGAKKCPVCNADLSLFDDVSMEDEFDIDGQDMKIENESLESLLGAVVSEMKDGAENVQTSDQFECPICGTLVDIDADVCPSCGAVFVEEEEQFECPVCGTLVDADATFCPKCGAKFVEEEPAAPTEMPVEAEEPAPSVESVPATPAPAPEPEPVESTPPERVSEPEPEPIKEPEPGISGPKAAQEPEVPPEAEEESTFLKKMKELRKEEGTPAVREEKKPEPEPETPAAERKEPLRPAAPAAHAQKEEVMDTREKYRKLPLLVSKVKPLLIIARQNNINVKKGKELIDKAVSAGKNRQIDDAINYITESRKILEESLTIYANHNLAEIEKDLPNLRAPEEVRQKLADAVESTRDLIRERDFDRAFQRLEIARRILKDHSGDFQEARLMLTELENTILDAEYFFMDVSRPKQLLANAKASAKGGDWATAGVYAREGLELMQNILPEMIKKEMKKARNVLLEAKMQGRDISKVISILKHASIASKSGNYGDALKYIKLFKAEMKR